MIQCKIVVGDSMPYNISEEKIEEVKDLNDIVDVINELIPLKKAGANYVTTCPFHKEKTPSFVVSPEKQIYHCFGCGEGGNVINFIMKYKNYTFLETIEFLAKRVGIVLEDKKNSYISNENKNKSEVLYTINREAAAFYYSNLKQDKKALKYLANRKIDSSVIKRFGIGYAKGQWDNLLKHLKNKGYSEKNILESGLIIKNSKRNSCYDRYRDRIIFPIIDTRKKVIGFGGRVLDNSLPKYINSPDSIVFSKGKNLYGLNIAKDNLKDKSIIIAEGYMDVIKLHIYGYDTAVASLGTALTMNQIRLMKKYTKKFYISYDSDNAGRKASMKALNMLKKSGIDAKVIVMPNGCDPDEYLSKHGKVKFDHLIKKSLDYYEYLVYFHSKILEDGNKVEFINKCFENINNINSSIERELILEKLASKTEVSKESILKDYKRRYNFNKKNKSKNMVNSIIKTSMKKADTHEKNVIELIIANNNLAKLLKGFINQDIFINDNYCNILQKIYNYKEQNIKITTETIGENQELKLNLAKIKKFEESTYEEQVSLFKECMKKIKMKYYVEKRREKQNEINKSINENEKIQLMEDIINLDNKLKILKEEVY